MPAPDAGTAPAIEFDALIDRCMGNLELMERAVAAFVEQFPAELDAVERAVQRGSREDVATITHRMKGSASNVAAMALAAEIAALESAPLDDSDVSASQSCQRLRAEWDRLLQAVS